MGGVLVADPLVKGPPGWSSASERRVVGRDESQFLGLLRVGLRRRG